MTNFLDLGDIATRLNKRDVVALNVEHIISIHLEDNNIVIRSKNGVNSPNLLTAELSFKTFRDTKEAYSLILSKIRYNVT